MKILFVSSDYPQAFQPANGLFNKYLVEALRETHNVRVVCPVPWTQSARGALRSRQWKMQHDAIHPTYYYSPKLFRNHYGTLMWWSVRKAVRKFLQDFRPDVVLGYWAHPDGEVAVRIAKEQGV